MRRICLWGAHMLRGITFAAIISADKISIYITKSKTRFFPRNLVFSNGPYVFVGFGFFRYICCIAYLSQVAPRPFSTLPCGRFQALNLLASISSTARKEKSLGVHQRQDNRKLTLNRLKKTIGKNRQAKSPRAVYALPEQMFCSVRHNAPSCLH